MQSRAVSTSFIVGFLLLVTACETPVAPVKSLDDPAIRLAVITNPRATFTYFDQGSELRADGTLSGFIRGDGRGAFGLEQIGSSVYDDGACGVKAQVFVGASGDATMDPTALRMSNCNNSVRRSVTLTYGAPIVGAGAGSITDAHFTNVREVEQLPFGGVNGNVAYRRFRLQPRGTTPCDYVRYGDTVNGQHVDFSTVIDGVSVTSIPAKLEAIGPNTWIASSQPNAEGKHVAVCEVALRKGVTFTAAYDIPFRIQVVMR